eukprot:scaffold4938_cov142-Isochrysis_galbana.AAC.3
MLNACKPLPNPSFRLFSFSWIAQFFNIPPSLPDRFAQLIRTFTPSHLLDMLYASGESAYMIGSTAPSSFDSRVYIVPPFNGMPRNFIRFERDLNLRWAARR